jgi:hypothetical protein
MLISLAERPGNFRLTSKPSFFASMVELEK